MIPVYSRTLSSAREYQHAGLIAEFNHTPAEKKDRVNYSQNYNYLSDCYVTLTSSDFLYFFGLILKTKIEKQSQKLADEREKL